MEKVRMKFDDKNEADLSDDDNDDDAPEIVDHYNDVDDDDDAFDDDKLTEESYRTTFDTNPDDLNLTDVADDEDF